MAVQLEAIHQAIRDTARDFAQNELRPHVRDGERAGEVPRELIEQWADLDMRGIAVPEEYGGGGLDLLSHAIVMEEFSKVWPSAGVKLDEGLIRFLQLFGDDAQKERYLPKLCSGELIDAIALTEPDHGSDLAGMETTAERTEGGYVLDGNKMWISNAGASDVMAVAAKTDPGERHHGISVFIVDSDADGVIVEDPPELMGHHASPAHEVRFTDCFVPTENRIGEENEGFGYVMGVLDLARTTVAARGLGIAAGAYEEALAYAQDRTQFDQPISEFQVTQHKLADMRITVEAARNLVYNAAKRFDAGEDVSLEASIAKVFAARAGREVANEAVQIHGGYGYSKEFPVEMLYRDAKVIEIYDGSTEIQKNIIAKQILSG
ncbi:acyl-CoA dehydrogenase family protein [Halobacteriales archaeon Cl-PHB]